MKETDLSAPTIKWLEGMGYEVFVEVSPPYCSGGLVDLVARKGRYILAVEMKLSLTRGVIVQVRTHDLFAHETWIVVGTKPRLQRFEKVKHRHFGVASCRDGQVTVLLKPEPDKNFPMEHYAEGMHERLDLMEPGGVAGKPTLKGEGPAQECYDRVQKYRSTHPGATWKEIFQNVGNHYSTHRSMAGAMGVVAGGRRSDETSK